MGIEMQFWLGVASIIASLVAIQWTMNRSTRADAMERHAAHGRRSNELAVGQAKLAEELRDIKDGLLVEIKENERDVQSLRAELHRDYVQAEAIRSWKQELRGDMREIRSDLGKAFERMDAHNSDLAKIVGRMESRRAESGTRSAS